MMVLCMDMNLCLCGDSCNELVIIVKINLCLCGDVGYGALCGVGYDAFMFVWR